MEPTIYTCRNCGATGPHLDEIDIVDWCNDQDPTDVCGLPSGTCMDCGAPVYEEGTFDKPDAARELLAALDRVAGNINPNDTGELIAVYITQEDAARIRAAITQAHAAGITPALLTK